MNNTLQLQGIGKVSAKRADELQPGDMTIWNYGYTHRVVSVIQDKASVRLLLDGDMSITKRAGTLVGIA